MNSTFTPLLQRLLALGFLLLLLVFASSNLYAQTVCDASTPVFKVDLTGKPNGVWTSPAVNRSGLCCTATSPDKCVQFEVTLDRLSGGLEFEISSGPVPPGAMFYQIGCGTKIAVGEPVCVMGAGPHKLTLCMPGNSSNTYTIRSIAAYEPVADAAVTVGCSQAISAPIAFDPASVSWNDVTYNGTYNKYLSCLSGCATTTVTPDATPPAFIDYAVCGKSTSAACTDLPYCDTVRVFFYPPLSVSISPDPAIICPGSAGVELSSNVSGGSGTYQYIWTNAAGTQLAFTPTYFATQAGTYFLEIRNENYPNCSTKYIDQVTVSKELSANAGPDQQVCAQNAVQLNGTVTGSIGGIWSGGEGTYSPSNTDLKAKYKPTPAEIASGKLTLTLSTTDNGSCTAVSDQVLILLYSFTTSINASETVCKGSTATLTAKVNGGISPYSYKWNTGETSQSISGKPAGTYTLTVTDAKGCTSQSTATVKEVVGPADLVASTKSSTCGEANGEITVSSVRSGTSPYSYSINGTIFQNSNTFNNLLAGTYTLIVKDAYACTYAEEVMLKDLPGPRAFTASTTLSSCTVNDGSLTVTAVTGGSSPYTYSINGSSYQTSNLFSALGPDTYTVWVKDANGCTTSAAVTISTNGPTAAVTTITAATCGQSDGSLKVDAITAGTAPFTYSLDGVNFQGSNTFGSLAAGTYTLTIKDSKGCKLELPKSISNKGGAESYGVAAVNESCDSNNGSIQISNVVGGSLPYAYSIDGINFQTDGSFTGLSEGNYQLTVKDANGCLTIKEQVLTNNPAPTNFSYTTQQETCGEANGLVMVSAVTGGTAPYSYSADGQNYQASSTISGLAAGSYPLSVRDAKGCIYSETVLIEGITGPSGVDYSAKDASCNLNDGEISITEVRGGTSPYSYSLDGTNFKSTATFTGLADGPYTLYVRDANGCSITKEAFVGTSGAMLDPVQHVRCFGAKDGQISITATQATEYTEFSINGGASFQKSPVFSDLQGGTYQVVIKLSPECTITYNDVVVEEPAQITAVVTQTSMAIGATPNGTAEITAVSGGTTPHFFTVDGVSYANITSLIELSAGEHTLLIQDGAGCEATILFTIEGNTGLEIPNGFTPNGDNINDRWALKNLALFYPGCKVAVYNRWGSPVFQSGGYAKEWDGTHNGKQLPDGTYYYIIQLNDQEKPLKGTVTIMR